VLNCDKALCLDRFSMELFQACWDVLKHDIMRVFLDLYARGKFERSLNVTFITLILKKSRTIGIKDFLPISLVVGVYKIVAKVLANILKMV